MFLPNRKLFTSNILICMAVALFAYFLVQTSLLYWLLLQLINLLLNLHFSTLLGKASFTPSAASLALDFCVLLICAYFWSYQKTSLKRVGATAALGIFLIPVTWYLLIAYNTLIISVLIVFGVTLCIALDATYELLSNRVKRKLVVEKHDAEYNILRHLNHNVKPGIQMAKSPVAAVTSFLQAKNLLNEPLAKRLDGSNETVGEALSNAMMSLEHINSILEAARELVNHEIRSEDFEDIDLCQLFRENIIPLYAAKLSIIVSCDRAITVRLHRQSFIEAMNNLIRNAEVHGFSEESAEAQLLFRFTERRKYIVIDYTNNGRRFPENLTEKDFVALGRKSVDSPGEGLGGAWIGKVIAAHNGSFEIIRDEQPLHFRITLPKGGA